MTKIDVISGFLGAGKTTLIKKLIKEGFKGEKLVLIENEFGEIGIDGGFLKEGGIEITEMNSGCICCSLVGDFGAALKDVLEKYHPDRIIIEPSGVGKLSDVIRAVRNLDEHQIETNLNCKTTIVDALKCKMYMKNFGEFFNNQIENATCIILSRSQKVSSEKLQECVNLIREHNHSAKIVTTPWENLSGETLLKAMERAESLEANLMEEAACPSCQGHHHHEQEHIHECCEHEHENHNHECRGHEHHHHHHHADEIFTSWGVETPHQFTEEGIREALETLSSSEEYGVILRAKGILQNEKGEWFCFDMVPGEYEIREEGADYTGRLCVIGTNLNEDGLKNLFGLER